MSPEYRANPGVGRRHLRNAVLAGGLALTLLFQPVAFAQLEEIVVTAQRREERLQETPISITVFTAQQLARPGLDDLSDVARFAPNVVFDQGTGSTGGSFNSQLFIRGVGQTDFLFASDPGVGLYVDEVYYPRVPGSILDVVDMERIEVLRGPQGTLFGKNTIGGALNITSQRPTGDFSGEASITAGSRDRIDGRITVNVPMVKDTLNGRFTFSSRNQDGYVERVNQDDVDLGDVDSDAFRGLLEWTPGDGWEVLVAGDYNRRREEAVANELVAVVPTDPALLLWNLLVAPTYGPGVQYDGRFLSPEYESQATGPSNSDLDMWGVSVNISKELPGNLTVKSITAYRETDAEFGQDQDHSPLTYLETTNDNRHDAVSQEFQLKGVHADGRLEWVAGFFYMHESGSDVFDLILGGGLYNALEALPAPVIPLAPGVPCPPPPGVLLPCAGGPGNPINVTLDFEVTIFDEIDIDSYAGYAQGTFHFNDKLSITAGGRYTDESKDFTTMLVRNASGVVTVPETTVSNSWDAFTPRVGFEYQWTPDLMTYMSASRGFKSGGFNGRAQSLAEIDSFDPEYVWSYEAGIKTEWFDKHLLLNLSAFYNDYTDIQLLSVRAVQGIIVVVTENAGEARIKGLELEMMAMPTDNLLVRGGLGYLDAKFTELDPGATVTMNDDLVKTPKWTGSLAVEYALPLSTLGTLSLGGDISYRSSYFNDINNTPLLKDDGYTLIGAHATFRSMNERWELTVFGTNIGDTRYMTNGLQSFGSFGEADGTFGPPAEWGVRLTGRF